MNSAQSILFVDGPGHRTLLPLTFTRPVAALRLGIVTIAQKWSLRLGLPYGFHTESYLQAKFPPPDSDGDRLLVFGGVLPGDALMGLVDTLQIGQAVVRDDQLLVARVNNSQWQAILSGESGFLEKIEAPESVQVVSRPYHLVAFNKEELTHDFELLTRNRVSERLSPSVRVVGVHQNPDLLKRIFIEPGALVEEVTLNPGEGPVYIGRDAVVMEGSLIRGPFAMCEHAQVHMGAKIYGGTTLGPWCKAGGELNNALMLGYSNKGHDGFLGDSVVGEWCNLGADTNTSNLKNDFAEVKLWDYESCRFKKTGLQFLGLIMGDFSRCGINTMFNSGTVIGVACNLYGTGYPRNFVPSFSLGGAQGFKLNSLDEACKTASMAMARRNVVFSSVEEAILGEVFESTLTFRTF